MDTANIYMDRIQGNRAQIAALERENEDYTARAATAKKSKGIEKWRGFDFESSSSLTPEFAAFARDYKKHITAILPAGASLAAFNRGHFYCSGFIQRGAKFVYFSMSDVRYQSGSWEKSILVRTAQHVKDYTGGSNNYADLENFTDRVERLLNA